MHGNIDEWCGAERDDETLSEYDREEYRIIRGGSWHCPASFARSARRVRTYPDIKSENLGFPVVLRDVE